MQNILFYAIILLVIEMKIKSSFVLKQIAGSYIVVPLRERAMDFSGVIKLTESGAFLWNILAEGAERDELVAALLKEYDVDDAVASRDVDRFITELREADLIE